MLIGFGADGTIVKPSGQQIHNFVYIMLEYIPGGLLYDLCENVGGLGEDGAHFFMEQFTDVITYLHEHV